MIRTAIRHLSLAAIPAAMTLAATATYAQVVPTPPQATWADLADLSDAAQLVVRAKVKKQAPLPPERAPDVAPGHVRLYVEAATLALISGNVPLGESLRYLVDVPLDARGKVPKLKNREVVLFARAVPQRPGEIQLVARDAQLTYDPALEQQLRPILSALAAPSAPPRVTGLRDALSVEGNLTGESETQMFLATASGAPVAISVVRRPRQPAVWGVSYSEIIDQAVRAPQPQTLGWYRLACFLPAQLPGSANLSREPADRARADGDYRFVMQQLGPCPRLRTPPAL